jgi:beta-1,4-mannosyl-glycoprotein beta-1,4-N-acetylglucosaminyltransferase
MFNDELALLDFRLRALDPVVDHFVLIESTRTHTGRPKRACFAENAAQFDAYKAKIRHVLVDDMPEEASPSASGPPTPNWVRERFQRAAVWRGLDGLGPEDLVMVGDLDEVPDPAVIDELKTTLRRPTRLVMRHFVFAANFELLEEWTDGTMVARGDQLAEPQMAVLMGDPDAAWSGENDHVTPRAGCHLSFLGGRDAVGAKLRAYAHEEFAVPALSRRRHLDRCVALGVHVAGIYAIKRRRLEELPPALHLLAEMHPELFDFRPGPPRLLVRLYLAYARVRVRLPLRLLDVIDAHPVPFAVVFGPFLLAFDGPVQTAAKYRLRHRARRAITGGRRFVRRTGGVLARPDAAGGAAQRPL